MLFILLFLGFFICYFIIFVILLHLLFIYLIIVELGREGLNKDTSFLDHLDVLIFQSGSIPKLNLIVINRLISFLRSFLKTTGFT
jgi:hypothetical protein